MKSTLWVIVTLLAVTIAVGCATAPKKVSLNLEPVELGPEGTAPITFTRLVIRVPAGTEVGSHHDGLLKVPQYKHYWQSSVSVASDEFKIVACEQLRGCGYTVLGGDNLLFGEDKSSKAEYQLGGTVKDLTYDTYAPLAGGYTEAWMEIEWQLYNVFRKEVVFSTTTSGYGKQEGTAAGTLLNAFGAALTNLMADSAFVDIVARFPSSEWETAIVGQEKILIRSCDSDYRVHLPDDLSLVLDSSLLIRAGESIGSGVVISQEGHALTAAHVVAGIDEVIVVLNSGLELSAHVLRRDEAQDVALIKLPGKGHSCVPAALGVTPRIGEAVFAVGSPSGEEYSFSVTRGIVSGLREFEGASYIQTDASLNPGNSGGPLLNENAEVIGIVSWKVSGIAYEGMSFGVPTEAIARRLGLEWN